ncbi:MAG: DUF3488 domain-containing protein, partial [Isosphaeraceae bacterium]|nr:DUF3488 domain-containing protein [Isosphaeraceae bacterium]
MRFTDFYRLSFYVMLFLAVMVLSIDAAAENTLSAVLPPVVAAAGVLAFLTVDRRPALGLPRDLANWLALGSLGLVYFEYVQDPGALALVLGHWLVYLTLVKMFLPKTIEDDWYLFLLALAQVVLGAFLSHSDAVGGLLMAWALTALWTLGLFHLHRESLRAEAGAGGQMSPVPDRSEPYPGLFDRPFLLAALRVAATTLGLGLIIFLAMPRWGAGALRERRAPVARHLTGFTERVKLGQIGEILENDTIVMSVEFYDEHDNRINLPSEESLLWRGVTLADYEDGEWFRQESTPIPFPDAKTGGRKLLKQRIKLEWHDSPVVFVLRPVLRTEYGGGRGLCLLPKSEPPRRV